MTIFRVHQAQQPFRDVVNAANSQCFSRCWSREQGDLALPNLLTQANTVCQMMSQWLCCMNVCSAVPGNKSGRWLEGSPPKISGTFGNEIHGAVSAQQCASWTFCAIVHLS